MTPSTEVSFSHSRQVLPRATAGAMLAQVCSFTTCARIGLLSFYTVVLIGRATNDHFTEACWPLTRAVHQSLISSSCIAATISIVYI